MKTTIKIDAARAVVIEPAGSRVRVILSTFGLTAFEQVLDPDAAHVMGHALQESAMLADIAAGRSQQAAG